MIEATLLVVFNNMDGGRWYTSTKQTAPGNVVAGLWSCAKDAWAIKKFGGAYIAVRVERGTHNTLHITRNTRFENKNASLGEYAGICIEVQHYKHDDQGRRIMFRMTCV